MKNLTDEQLVRLYVDTQKNQYFELLYARYCDKIYRKCLSFIKDPAKAEDLTHDIFLRLVLKLNTFKEEAKFSTWLYSITYNYCADQLRTHRKLATYELHEEYQGYSENWDENEAELVEMEARQLQQALHRLSPDEQVLLRMKYQDDASIRELAELNDLTESAVKMRLKRSREKLKKYYLEGAVLWLLMAMKAMMTIRSFWR
jgi:RNA polymerase sigma factor (sigma-70 family)